MVNQKAMESVTAKLTAVKEDIQQSKVRVRIDRIEKVDGKFSTSFSISGLPSKKGEDSYLNSYMDIPKIFNTWAELSTYADAFFSASDDELVKIAQNK